MPIYATKKEADFTPAPEGLHAAVCVDVIDLGIQKTMYGEQVKIKIVWQLEDADPKTKKRYLVSKRYTPSMHEKATLRKDLETWRGRKFTEEEQERFDIEKLLNASCMLSIAHNIKSEGQVYANVQAVVPLARGMAKVTANGYTRKVDLDKQREYEAHPDGMPDNDEYIPF